MKKQRRWLILSIAAVLLILTGIYAGEPETVLKKSINICLECIGIG